MRARLDVPHHVRTTTRLLRPQPSRPPLLPLSVYVSYLLATPFLTPSFFLPLCVIRDMEGAGLRPNLVCFTSAITACQRGGEWRKALSLFLRMTSHGPRPDVVVRQEANNYIYNIV